MLSVDEVVNMLLRMGWDGIGVLFACGESLRGEAGEFGWSKVAKKNVLNILVFSSVRFMEGDAGATVNVIPQDHH